MTTATVTREGRRVRMHSAIPQSPKPRAEQQLKEAVERVYERYGADLSAFYRDVEKEIKIKRGA